MLVPFSISSPPSHTSIALGTVLLLGLPTTGPLLADGTFVHAQRADIEGMGGAIASALAPDGRTLYVASFSDSAVVRFRRDPPSGALTFLDAEYDNDAPAAISSSSLPGKGNIYDGLLNVADLVISADGAYLYSAGWGDDAIGIFRISPAGLIPLGALRDPATSLLDSVAALALSPDGTFLYAAASGPGSVCAMTRDPVSGSLVLVDYLVSSGLAGARDVVVTTDGSRLLAATQDMGRLLWIDLDPSLTQPFLGWDLLEGLPGASALALSPDDQDVYVATIGGQRIAHLRRSGPGYVLVNEQAIEAGAKTGVWVAPDGSAVFASNLDGSAVHRLVRDPADGTLSDPTTFSLSSAGDGMAAPVGLTGTPDGRNLYVTSLSGHVAGLWVDQGPAVEAIHSLGPGPPFSYTSAIAWSPTGDLYALSAGGLLHLGRDPRSGAVRLLGASLPPAATFVAVSPTPTVYALGSQGEVTRWSTDLVFQGSDVLPLTDITSAAISPDGSQLLATSALNQALVAFAIHPVNGSLYEVDRVDASDGLGDLLSRAYDLAFSPGGERVYVATWHGRSDPPELGGQVGVFERQLPGGALSFRGAHAAGQGTAHQVPGVAVSPDGRHVYAAGLHGGDLYGWEETGTTLVGPVTTLIEGVDGVTGLEGAWDLTVSGDGRQVAVVSVFGSVSLFHRDPVSGALSLRRTLSQYPGIDEPIAVVSSADGHYLYVADAGTYPNAKGEVVVLDLAALFLDDFESGDASAWSVE